MAIKVHVLGSFVSQGQDEFVNYEKEKWEREQYVSSHETNEGRYIVKAKGPNMRDALRVFSTPRCGGFPDGESRWNFDTLGVARALFRAFVQFDKIDVVLMHVEFNA